MGNTLYHLKEEAINIFYISSFRPLAHLNKIPTFSKFTKLLIMKMYFYTFKWT